MDDIALNPDFYDLFREPVLVTVVFVWLAAVLLVRLTAPRKVDWLVYLGVVAVGATALDPILRYAEAEIPLLRRQTETLYRAGSADPLRARDPLFGLLQIYLQANPASPLIVVEDETGETVRWAGYYLAPRPIFRAREDGLRDVVPEAGDGARWILARRMPPLADGAVVSVEGRVDDWLLIKLMGDPGAP